MLFKTANLTQLDDFDEIIDVRTPAEFADDHIPGAINCPVLSNEERVTVGTLYKQVSPFEARKVGAALISRNIAHHLETLFMDKPKSWKPLIYCWRGGQRSGAMSIIMGQVGWAAHKLEGGYKTYRREVLSQLETLPASFSFRIICGPTGSGKSRFLDALTAKGAQVLDLEGLANHRGSVLGGFPSQAQPSPKSFETALVQAMRKLDPARPVFIEAESSKIGRLTVPSTLITAMHSSACVLLDTSREARIALLMEEYQHFVDDPETLIKKIEILKPFHGAKRIEEWEQLIRSGNFNTLVDELLALHYDPGYQRSHNSHYGDMEHAHLVQLTDTSIPAMRQAASTLLSGVI
ncbi:MAG: tRNA 2-selenouridine(34) synthase MnmH [Gammaproteobacteria bacterium]|nr:tRNA 2-selenouridine(34) synthase MnmH [Gammaproteobacteria bacterium]MBU1625429.1 tRNA 2-selenouridine(34) synthase MnmH [Gammaproteobacteria bacterium]MBU1981689.1 tRNA 2-selenouridine(34) synthase MnmH [Gammaproteobacteria bacterium]